MEAAENSGESFRAKVSLETAQIANGANRFKEHPRFFELKPGERCE